jgi:hypothetical protein
VNAIPTRYAGRQYRSRLEARWAAFFTMLGWPFEYEPLDFKGWIPDFVLMGARRVFVEVKPVEIFPENIADEVDRSGCEDEILIVGTTMLRSEEFTFPSLGWLGELDPEMEGGKVQRIWQSAVVGCWSGAQEKNEATPLAPIGNPRRVLGFCPELGYWRDRITGFYDGGCYGHYEGENDRVFRMWQEAGNVVQWKGRTAA